MRSVLLSSIFKRNRWVYLAVLLAGGAYIGIRIAALKYLIMTGVDRSIPAGSILQHILLFCKSVANYLLLILWPFNSLSPIHYSRLPVPTNDASAWLALILVVILAHRTGDVDPQAAAHWLAGSWRDFWRCCR